MLREFYYMFLPYRSFISPILAVSAIVIPCWLAFRLYRHRNRRHPLSLRREMLLLTFVFYLASLAAVTLSPNRSSRMIAQGTGRMDFRPSVASLTCSSATLAVGSRPQAFCVHNARGNVLLFIPLGILLPLVWSHLRFRRTMLAAIALSVSIELAQYLSSAWGSYRSADVNDVILNSAGACLGLLFVSLLRWRPRTRPAVPRAL